VTERLVHERSKDVLADRIDWARTSFQRARGLIGRPALEPGAALVIGRAPQVHTFFVRFPIDVVFCDEGWTVLYVVSPMGRRRISRWVRRAAWVVELPAGTAAGIEPGDTLSLQR
jgi:uncharacterized membrane protein (UPF0127 family)